jgi:hypothetical protein
MAIQDQIDLQEKRKAALYEAAVASYPNLKLNP